MKRGLIISLFLVGILFFASGIYAEACGLSISLINQDPYPAIPGDYVKVVFQVDGIANPECGQVEIELLEKYPISLDPTENAKITVNSGVYKRDYSSFLLTPYKVRVDGDALNGDNPIEVQYKDGSTTGYTTKQFNLNVEDSRADFEIYVKSYDSTTRELTFEILNIAEADIEALTLEIPDQENIEIKGSKTNIVGDLDSNEYTTADFEAIPKDGEITIKLSYSDSTNTRRTLEKTIEYESKYFQDRIADQKSTSTWTYIFYLIIILVIIWFIRRTIKKRKAKEKHK